MCWYCLGGGLFQVVINCKTCHRKSKFPSISQLYLRVAFLTKILIITIIFIIACGQFFELPLGKSMLWWSDLDTNKSQLGLEHYDRYRTVIKNSLRWWPIYKKCYRDFTNDISSQNGRKSPLSYYYWNCHFGPPTTSGQLAKITVYSLLIAW